MLLKLTNEEIVEVIKEQEPVYLVDLEDMINIKCSLITIGYKDVDSKKVYYRYKGSQLVYYSLDNDLNKVVFRSHVEAVDYMLDTMETYTKRMIDALNIGIDRVNEYASRVRNYSKRIDIKVASIINNWVSEEDSK